MCRTCNAECTCPKTHQYLHPPGPRPQHAGRACKAHAHNRIKPSAPARARSTLGAEEVARAKRAAVSVIYNALESKATSAEDIGRQFLTYGHR